MSRSLVEESTRSRRIVGQLSRGDHLAGELVEICDEKSVRCGLVHATGVVEEVRLACYLGQDRSMGRPRRFDGAMQLLQASGMVAEHKGQLHLELSVLLARQRDNGLEVLGGICSGARVITCAFVIEAFDDLIVRRRVDANTGLSTLRGVISATTADPDGVVAEAAAADPQLTSSKPNWADAVMASVRAAADKETEEPEEDEGEYRPVQVGDILQHQKFGRCQVQRVDVDQEYVTVRLRNSRLVRLNIDVLNLRYSGDEDGHQVFVSAPAA